MVRADNGHHRIRKAHSLQDLRADDRVDLHFLEFLRRQPARLRNDVLRNRQFPNVVQQGCRLQRLALFGRDLEILGDLERVDAHPLQVVVRGLVLGFDRQSQRFDGAHVQVGDFLYVPLFIFQLAQIQPIRAVDQVHHRQNQQRRLPVGEVVQPTHHPGYPCPHQVVREAPEVAVRPDPSQGPALSKRNHRRYRHGIRDEVNARRHKQQRGWIPYHSMKQGEAISSESCRNGQRRGTDIESDLNRNRTIAIKALHDYRGAAQSHSFREAQFQHAQQQEQEVHRHRAGDARQVHFQPRSHQRDDQITEKLERVAARAVQDRIGQHTHPA